MALFNQRDIVSIDGNKSKKAERVERLRNNHRSANIADTSYTTISEKEALCSQYVKNFEEKFNECYPGQRNLLLNSPNEFGINKFVCCTLRPTVLPYQDFHKLEDCSEFVANFLQYEPLENAQDYPSCLPSLTQVLDWKIGDSFDFSLLLCSFLLGVGYDAYVAYGTAPYWITIRDQTNTSCPNLDSTARPEESFLAKKDKATTRISLTSQRESLDFAIKDSTQPETDLDSTLSPYTVIPRASLISKFDSISAKDKSSSSKANVIYRSSNSSFNAVSVQNSQYLDISLAQAGPDNSNISMAEIVEQCNDKLFGRRMHAWVVILSGQRDVNVPLCVESSTGRLYPLNFCPYLSIKAIFNNKNYWINMQNSRTVNEINYNLKDIKLWEYVFNEQRNICKLEKLNDSSPSQCNNEPSKELLELPQSWVKKLFISHDDFATRYPPNGSRMILYRKCKLELFSKGFHEEGLVKRVTLFSDELRTEVVEIRELFIHRRDRLVKRVYSSPSKLNPGYLYESFCHGRKDCLKEVIDYLGENRIWTFYASARFDKLSYREEKFGSKVFELYENRSDRLIYRSISLAQCHDQNTVLNKQTENIQKMFVISSSDFTSSVSRGILHSNSSELAVFKMTEKFSRNNEICANEDVAKRSYYIAEGRILIKYHYSHDRIICNYETLWKDNRFRASGFSSSSIDLGRQNDSEAAVQEKRLTQVVRQEKQCFDDMRHVHLEMIEIARSRFRDENNIVITKPIHDIIRAKHIKSDIDGRNTDSNKSGNSKDEIANDVTKDYLASFLNHIADMNNITHEEALRTKEACLLSTKERLIERANIINTRLIDERSKLTKRQLTHEHNPQDEDDDYDKFCADTIFRIQVLEQRLVHHEANALQKYAELDAKIIADPRLKVLSLSTK